MDILGSETARALESGACVRVCTCMGVSMAQVYKVWNAAQRRVEALSVMDREHIAGDEEVVSCASDGSRRSSSLSVFF